MAHKYTSWGRTRTPKALYEGIPDDYANQKRTVAAMTVSTVGNLDATLASGTEGRNGYATENQRFLHVTVSAASGKNVIIYVYHYATQVWAPLMINLGNGSWGQATASTVSTGTTNLQPQTFIFEIAGADRVAFVSGDPPTIHAATSTF